MIVQFYPTDNSKNFFLKCISNNGEALSKKILYNEKEFLKLLNHCQEGLETFHSISCKYAPIIMLCHLKNLKVSELLKDNYSHV